MLQRLKTFFAAEPDQALVRARAASERMAALVRLILVGALVLSNLVAATSSAELLSTLVLGGSVLAYAFLVLRFAERARGGWLPWAVSAADVSFASVTLWVYVFMGHPIYALNNRVLFDTYFVAITISALRYDWRLCAGTTLFALLHFAGLTAYCAHRWDLATLWDPLMGQFVLPSFRSRLVVIAGQGVAAATVAQWARHLRLLIGTDHLTGLLQRRPFLERISEELTRGDPSKSSLSVALFDVDEFKRFNDAHGHLAGDRALQFFADHLRRAVRTTDLVARYGGEEFVVAFPRMDVQMAMRRVDLLRAEFALLPLGPDGQRLTVSAGVASWPTDGATFDEVLTAADERLYTAKRSGRNLVIGPAPVGLRAQV